MTTSMPPTGREPDEEGPVQTNWPLTLLVVLLCLAVVASGWGVARLTLGERTPGAGVEDSVARTPPPGLPAVDVDPSDAEAFVESAAQELRAAPSYHVSYTQRLADREAGHGWARHEPGSDPVFKHYFSTASGVGVYRYDLSAAGFMMTAEEGVSGVRLLDPPSEADVRLCSVDFAVAAVEELALSAKDLALVGTERIRLAEGPEGFPAGTHNAHRYTGTFQPLMGGYDPSTGRNTLTRVPEAEFDLWVDEEGHPRRLSYTSPEGTGETFDYHAPPG